MPNDDPKPSSQSPADPPSPGQLQDPLQSGEKKSPTSQGTPEPSRRRIPSGHDLAEDDLVERKKDLVAAFDKLLAPLDRILLLMQRATTFGILLLAVLAVVQIHTTLRIVAVEERLDNIVETQKTLTAAATAQEQQQASQSQITIEPAVTPSGAPTAIIVVRPPTIVGSSSAKVMRPVPIALSPTTTSTVILDGSVARPPPLPRGSASAVAPPAPAPPAALTVKFE